MDYEIRKANKLGKFIHSFLECDMSIFHVSKLKKKENIWKDWKGKGKKRADLKKERHEKFYFSFTPIHCWKRKPLYPISFCLRDWPEMPNLWGCGPFQIWQMIDDV